VSKDIGISPPLWRSASRTVSAPRRRVALQLSSAFYKVLSPYQLLGKQLAARNLSVIYVINVLHREVDFVG
jgi:hypothetical protein